MLKHVKEEYGRLDDPTLELWELNERIKGLVLGRIERIERNINIEFENFDEGMKRCSNTYCGREYRSEESYFLGNLCSCGSTLELKIEKEVEAIRKVTDRANALKALKFLRDFIAAEVREKQFPLLNTLTGYKSMMERNQGAKEQKEEEPEYIEDDVDDRYRHINDFKLKYIKIDKEFLRPERLQRTGKRDEPELANKIKELPEAVKSAFRIADIRHCLQRYCKTDHIERRVQELRKQKERMDLMSEAEYVKEYTERMGKLVYPRSMK